jgi:hypothetical protein
MARFGYRSSILTSLNLCVLAPLREILLWRLGVRSLSAVPAFSAFKNLLSPVFCLLSPVFL